MTQIQNPPGHPDVAFHPPLMGSGTRTGLPLRACACCRGASQPGAARHHDSGQFTMNIKKVSEKNRKPFYYSHVVISPFFKHNPYVFIFLVSYFTTIYISSSRSISRRPKVSIRLFLNSFIT